VDLQPVLVGLALHGRWINLHHTGTDRLSEQIQPTIDHQPPFRIAVHLFAVTTPPPIIVLWQKAIGISLEQFKILADANQ
jgi:hypothetical protein